MSKLSSCGTQELTSFCYGSIMIKRLFSRSGSTPSSSTGLVQRDKSSSLGIEELEPRMMLSTVSIFASGETGEESMTVWAGDQIQTFENVPVEGDVYVFETPSLIVDDVIIIEFTNDLYLPDQGIDRNLTVEKLVLDGVEYQTTNENVFASGVWDPQLQSLTAGPGLGPTLHANGFFDFFISPGNNGDVFFGDQNWNVVDGPASDSTLSVSDSDVLTISGVDGAIAISTRLEVEPEGFYRWNFNAERQIVSGQFTSDSQPWATVGIDYYDFNGSLISQERVDLNSQQSINVQRDIQPPANATSAYMWVWIDQFSDGTNIPLKISNFSFEQFDLSDDVTPPTAEFESFTFDNNFVNEISFNVLFQDDFWLDPNYTGSLTVTGPNGFNKNPFTYPSGSETTPMREEAFFAFRKNDGSYFDTTDNGVYTVTLNSNVVSDQVGNFAPGQILGTITVDITDQGPDTTPPNISLIRANDVFEAPTGGRGSDIEFGIEITDDRPFAFFEDIIRIDGPNGYSRIGVGFAGGPAGGGPYGYFEAIFMPLPIDGAWSSNENGTYTVSLDTDIIDAAGNVTPAQELGTFVINIA